MVTVELLKSGGRLAGFTASGHAEFADSGSDIVCAAISAITQTAILGLRKRTQAGVSVSESEGIYCILGKDCTERELSEAETILDTMFLGLHDIKENYGNYLDIIEREV